jgi:Collagen triple helix repeat (20 copies)
VKRSAWTTAVIAAAAIALLGLGSAGAAQLITGGDIKDFSIQAKDISGAAKKALRGQRGKRGRRGRTGKIGKTGPAGAQGAAGIQGTQGLQGVAGSAGAVGPAGPAGSSLVLGAVTPPLNPAGAAFAFPAGSGQASPTEPSVQVPTPAGVGVTVSDLSALASTAPGPSRSYTISVRVDGADTAVKCKIADPATTCVSASAQAVPAGSKLSIQVLGEGGAAPATISWGFRAVPAAG